MHAMPKKERKAPASAAAGFKKNTQTASYIYIRANHNSQS